MPRLYQQSFHDFLTTVADDQRRDKVGLNSVEKQQQIHGLFHGARQDGRG
jgi:hypothetical protein